MTATSSFPAAQQPRRSVTACLFGLFLILAGLLFTAANFKLLPFQPTLVDLLPLLFAIVAADRLIAGRPAAALVWLAVGGGVAFALFGPGLRLGQLLKFWPLLVVLIGVSTVLRALGLGRRGESGGSQGELAFFSSLRNRLDDPAYRGGSCIALLGGQRLDLRGATLAETGALLQVFVMWGGIEVIVPESWSVSTQVFATLGGADDKSRPLHALPAGLPRLVIRGVVVMGGLEIHN